MKCPKNLRRLLLPFLCAFLLAMVFSISGIIATPSVHAQSATTISLPAPDFSDSQDLSSGTLKFRQPTPEELKLIKQLNALIISLQPSVNLDKLSELSNTILQARSVANCFMDITKGIANSLPVQISSDVVIPVPQFPPSTAEDCGSAFRAILDHLKNLKVSDSDTPIFIIG